MKGLLILGMVFLSAQTFAGNEKGNGGGVHYCQSNKTQELYDIYEAQARYGYQLVEKKLSVDGYIDFALNKIKENNSYVGGFVEEQLKYLKNGHMIFRSKIKLTTIEDVNVLVLDEGCNYKQLANWDEVSGNILVNKDLYESMNNLNKAALYVHEAIYKVGRDKNWLIASENNRVTSDRVRKMVGEIFSDREQLENLWKHTDPQIYDGPIFEELFRLQKECSEGNKKAADFFRNTDNKCAMKNEIYTSIAEAQDACIVFRVTAQHRASDYYLSQVGRASVIVMATTGLRHEREIDNVFEDYFRATKKCR